MIFICHLLHASRHDNRADEPTDLVSPFGLAAESFGRVMHAGANLLRHVTDSVAPRRVTIAAEAPRIHVTEAIDAG